MFEAVEGFNNVLISALSVDRRYFRRLQMILEDRGFMTSMLRFAQAEINSNHPGFNDPEFVDQYGEVSPSFLARYTLFRESTSEFFDFHIHVISSGYERYLFERVALPERDYVVDIEDCLDAPWNELDARLEAALDLYFTESPAPQKPGVLSDAEEALLAEAQDMLNKFDQYDDSTILSRIYETHGKLAKAFNFIQKFSGTSYSWLGQRLSELELKYTSYSAEPARESIFISHSTRDLRVVRRIQIALEQINYRTYIFTAGYLRDLTGQMPNRSMSDAELARRREVSEKLKTQVLKDTGQGLVRLYNNLLARLGLVDEAEIESLQDVAISEYLFTFIRWEILSDSVDMLLAVDSEAARDSIWTILEQHYAMMQGKPVIEINIDDLNPDDSQAELVIGGYVAAMMTRPPLTPPEFNLSAEDLPRVLLAEYWRDKLRGDPMIIMRRRSEFNQRTNGAFERALTYLETFRPRKLDWM